MEPRSCDTFVVLPPLTSHGGIVFGKNSDRPQGEVQEVVYYPSGEHGPGDMLDCTYIKIDQASRTHAVILSKPAWMWGAEMGANDCGVVIGNEAVWTKLCGPDDNIEKLLGMDLLRLALERAGTAGEAIDVITELLERYGQGGPCSDVMHNFSYHNSFLICDPNEAWVLETAGSEWAAEKVTGCRNISNNLSIGTKIDRHSKTMKDTAKKLGFWDGQSNFHFASVYGEAGTISYADNREKRGRKLLQKLSEGNKFTITNMFTILRDEDSGICCSLDDGFPTMGSQVSLLNIPHSGKPHCHWFTGTPDPNLSIFKPFIFTPNPSVSVHMQSPKFEPDPAKIIPRFRKKVDRQHNLYKCHSTATNSKNSAGVIASLQEVEKKYIADVEKFLQTFLENQNLKEVENLFKDAVETEIKLYK